MSEMTITQRQDVAAPKMSLLVLVFTMSILCSSLLLFSVQPIFAKMALPLLGGAPNVWNTAMVFFQVALLGGYVYAHVLTKYLVLPRQVLIHAGLLIVAFGFLPLHIADGWTSSAASTPALWLMGLFAVSIGLPFFALSANAPLLQKWFSYSAHKNATDPYFLYAASNIGSLVALLSYPVLIEPLIGVRQQTLVWTMGYGILVMSLVISGVCVLRSRPPLPTFKAAAIEQPAPTIEKSRYLVWIGLAFIPSSLMLGLTSHLTANVAATPFIWVIPLSLYLLTFIIAFSSLNDRVFKLLRLALMPALVLGLYQIYFVISASFITTLVSLAAVFFIAAQYCHSRLSSLRPETAYLTTFYVCLSIGGVLGGAFNALLAPVIFNSVHEYGLVLALCGVTAAGAWPSLRRATKQIWPALGFLAFALVSIYIGRGFNLTGFGATQLVMIWGLILLVIWARKPAQITAALVAILLVGISYRPLLLSLNRDIIFKDRSFFGVVSVEKSTVEAGEYHSLVNGNTVHNHQMRDPLLRQVPLAYYSEYGAFSAVIKATQSLKSDGHFAVIGLGAGAVACYQEPSENWVYYEIDPLVVKVAQDPALFSYLSDCAPDVNIVIGDARLTIDTLPDHSLDVLMVDAFSSNAIPAHLVTREALAIYRTKMKPAGVILFHTSNRFLNISDVVISLADDAGLAALEAYFVPPAQTPYGKLLTSSSVVLVGETTALQVHAAFDESWKPAASAPGSPVWTDDYSHILGALKTK